MDSIASSTAAGFNNASASPGSRPISPTNSDHTSPTETGDVDLLRLSRA